MALRLEVLQWEKTKVTPVSLFFLGFAPQLPAKQHKGAFIKLFCRKAPLRFLSLQLVRHSPYTQYFSGCHTSFMRVVWALCILIIVFSRAQAQDVAGLPVSFHQFTRSYFLINPASTGTESNLEVNVGRQFNTDEWSNIYTHYANINLQLTPKRKASNYTHHTGGINLIGDKEGDYLSRTRLYLLYSLHVILSEKASLAAGASVGFVSYTVSGTNISRSGSASTPDGSVGVWLYDTRGGHLGLSINQLPNGTLTPIEETTRLLRHYNVSLRKAIQLNAQLALYPALLVRYTPRHSTQLEANAILVMNDLFSVGAASQYKRNFSLMAGLERIPALSGQVKAAFSYTLPAYSQVFANFSSYELTVRFSLDKHQKEVPAAEEEK